MSRIDFTLTREYLKECFDYNPDTGVLIWRERPISHFKTKAGFISFNRNIAGNVAGYEKVKRNGEKYHYTKLSKVKYSTHRLIWILTNDEIPDEIDHKDGNGLNNAISNLRNVNSSGNAKNRKFLDSNTSGCTGVKVAESGNYSVSIHIGTFPDYWDAICARKSAEYIHGYYVNHGSMR